jgi:hypothetical protein
VPPRQPNARARRKKPAIPWMTSAMLLHAEEIGTEKIEKRGRVGNRCDYKVRRVRRRLDAFRHAGRWKPDRRADAAPLACPWRMPCWSQRRLLGAVALRGSRGCIATQAVQPPIVKPDMSPFPSPGTPSLAPAEGDLGQPSGPPPRADPAGRHGVISLA